MAQLSPLEWGIELKYLSTDQIVSVVLSMLDQILVGVQTENSPVLKQCKGLHCGGRRVVSGLLVRR